MNPLQPGYSERWNDVPKRIRELKVLIHITITGCDHMTALLIRSTLDGSRLQMLFSVLSQKGSSKHLKIQRDVTSKQQERKIPDANMNWKYVAHNLYNTFIRTSEKSIL